MRTELKSWFAIFYLISLLLLMSQDVFAGKCGCSADFGGVSLSKTAELMLDINDIEGATYDEATGQVILYGKSNTGLPQMNLDDLAIAVRSIYGYGGQAPQDPGVSIGTEPSDIPGLMKVRYDGQTNNTEFGWTMFESDRMLKILSIGKDNITGQPVTSSVPGYKNMLQRYIDNGGVPGGATGDRMWFVPKEISLGKSDDDTSMIFNTVTMELLTESKFQDNVVDNPVAEAFASHFTQNYDNFANERPILKDLKTLGKITAVVKWIRDNNIPFDLSFFDNYTPAFYSTPGYTPQISNSGSGIMITGGVKYHLDASNFTGTLDPAADQTKAAALTARQNETDFTWNFQSQGQNYQAVAHSMTRSQKDGGAKRTEMDMIFPVQGDNRLSLTRYYNSFNDKSSGFGYGWDMIPSKLRFPADKWAFTFGGQSITVNAYYQIFISENGSEDLYTLYGLNGDQHPVYIQEGEQHFLTDNMDGTFTLNKKNKGTVSFDSQGRLTRTTDNNGIYISYNYSGSRLVSISHQGGRTITLNYNANNLINSAVGPGSKTMYYTYDVNGNLITVKNELNEGITYSYDIDRRLISVLDPRGNAAFQATFDDYNRATAQTLGSSANYSNNFNLANRVSTEINPNNVTTTKSFDEDYRVTNWTDSLGRQTDITYDANDFGPATVTDPNRNITEYGYDAAGNVNYTKDANGVEKQMFYDYNNNLVIARDGRGYDTAYVYDPNNRLTEIRHNAVAEVDGNGRLAGNYSYDPSHITSYTYDPANGNLLSETDPEGRVKSYTYDGNGMLLTTTTSSGYRVTNTYDDRSRLTNISDLGGGFTSYGYDAADRKTSITNPVGTTMYTYDANGNKDIIYDAKTNPTDYDYDANNNLIKVTDAELGVTDYEYDIVNNLLRKIFLPNGSIKEIEYDDLNRPIREIYRITNPTPKAAVLVDTLDIGSTIVGNSTSREIPICNVGNASLSVANIVTDNPDFTVNTTTATILPGECLNIQVTFTGTSAGSESATLTITFGNSPTITINLNAQVVLDPLNASAVSELTGIRISWDLYSGAGTFDHYNVYRSTAPITDISGLTSIATFNNIADTDYLDMNVVLASAYHYCVVAFDSGMNMLTGIESIGPVAFLNLGNIGDYINAASSGSNEKSVSIAFNGATKEYLLVYEYDYSGSGANYDIYAQRVSGDGSLIGSSFAIMNTAYHENNPQIIYNSANNEYMVVAEYDSNGAGLYQIKAQRVSATGSLIGGLINVLLSSTAQYSPGIAYNSQNNQYLVVFENDYASIGREAFVWTVLGATGNLLAVNGNYLSGDARFKKPKVAFNNNANEYLVVFEYTNNSTYSDIVGLRQGATGAYIGNPFIIFDYPNVSSYPDVAYISARNEYAVIWQYDSIGDGSKYVVLLNKVSSTGGPGLPQGYSAQGSSLMWPALAYFEGQNEYLMTATYLSNGEYDVLAQRISADDLSLLTDYTIGVATESSKAERKSYIVYNNDRQEFLIGYEYEYDTSNWDIRAQRIGKISQNINIDPQSLDFGSDLTQQDIQVRQISGENYMRLVNTTDQSWLSVTPATVEIPEGTTNPEATLTVSVNRTNLPVGNYSGDVLVTSDGITSAVHVTMTIGNAAPSAPSNPTPLNGATDQSGLGYPLTVVLSWLSSDPNTGDTLTYDVYFSDNQSLVDNSDPSVLIANNVPSNTYQTYALQYGKAYYWRIKARDSFGFTTIGNVWSFTTSTITAPQLTSYSPDPTKIKRPVLYWSIVQGVQRYRIQMDNNPDFSSPLIDNNNVTANSYPLSSDLPEGNIYWHVASIDNQGQQGSYSGVDDFTVDTISPSVPLITVYAPDPTSNRRPILAWQSVTDALNYHIQISAASDFQTLLVNKYVPNTSDAITSDLPEGNVYWRVSSIDMAGNESNFSVSDNFLVDITPPAQIIGLAAAPEQNNIRLTWDHFVNIGGDFNHFNIYRSASTIDNVSQLTPIAQLSGNPNTTTYLDNTAIPGELYFYAVTAVDNAANENKAVIDISNSSPNVDFIASPTSGPAPLTVNFFSSSTGYDQPLTYAWDFDNNGSVDSTLQNPPYTFGQGLFTVKLTVTDSDGSQDSLTMTNYITVTPPVYTLTLSKQGSGNGTVTSSPSGIDCGPDCTEVYNLGTTLTLTALPNAGSQFTGWTGGDCSGTGICALTMNANTTVTATFDTCSNLPVQIIRGGSPFNYYSSVQTAYNDAIAGDIIQAQAALFTENLSAGDISSKSITIEGGFNCGYTAVIGKTAIKGQMTISKGTNRVKNVVIKK